MRHLIHKELSIMEEMPFFYNGGALLHALSIRQLLELRYDQIHDELIHKSMGLKMGLVREDDCFLDKGQFRDLWISGDHDDFGFGSIEEIFPWCSISNLLFR